MSPRFRLIAAVAATALAVAFARRPVRPPAEPGTWHPAEPQRSNR